VTQSRLNDPNRLLAGSGWLLLLLTAFSAVAAEPKRVLVVHSFGNAAPPFTTASTAFETVLTEEMGEPVDLDEVSLDVARYATLDMEEALVELMRKRQTKWQPDLVVPIGSPAGAFVAQQRDRLFPATTPIIYTGMDQRRLPAGTLQRNATFVGASYNLPGAVDDILQLKPDTTNVVIILGATPLERFWAEVLRREYAVFTNRLNFTWFNDLSFDQVLERSARLPPRSFMLLILYMRDASGVTHNSNEALERLREVANAPINGLFDEQLGRGIVGGRIYSDEHAGREAARIAVRILRGEPATSFPPRILEAFGPQYDWRELRRWNISEDRLPPGSKVLFREGTVWERYGKWVLVGMAICVAQTLLIVRLLVHRRKRLRAEAAAREFGGRLIRAQEEERARLARELHDDITQRLAVLAIDAGRMERANGDSVPTDTMRGIREGLVRLSEDVHSLSYKLHPSLLEDLGLPAAIRAECESFAQQESVRCDVKVSQLPEAPPRDTALGLFRVTQEALRNVARHARASAVEVTLRPLDGGWQLAVRDNGVGFDPSLKRERTSIGLLGMMERAQLLGGELDIESAPGHGTTVVAWVPLKGQRLKAEG
jgi:signal transduction histidine kinase